MANKPTADQLEQLRSSVTGQVLLVDDEGYEASRTGFYSWVQKHPAAVVKVKNAEDVSAVVNFCREHGIELAVRGGGHSSAGHSSSNGGVVIDLAEMNAIEVDVENETMWAETGAKAGPLTHALAEHGFVVGFGDTGSVGIGGITLGGGVGYLVRKHGLTIDNLLTAEVVTADGRLLRASVDENPDLFWALRGGGGNFGVATRFQYRMHKSGQGYGGMLVLPAEADVLAGFMKAAADAPEELSCIANVMTAPPMPFLPEEMHGKVIILALMYYAGEAAEGERALAPFVNLATPLANMLAPMRYADLFQGDEEGPMPAGAASQNMHMREVDVATAQTILDRLNVSSAAMAAVQLRPLGGAMARVHSLETAYAHRLAPIMVNVAALYNDTTEADMHAKWVQGTVAALDQGEQGVYVNFIGDEGPARVRAAYPGLTWGRLVQIKKKYDPENLFRLNQNISPV
jgi:FAD/FMN-containing dehydrogenase